MLYAKVFLVTWVTIVFALFGTQQVASQELVLEESTVREVVWNTLSNGNIEVDASMSLLPSKVVREALYQGVPIYFVANVILERDYLWLWSRYDVDVKRYVRISYLPLSGAWRMQISQKVDDFSDQYLGLAQIYSSLSEVLVAIQNIRGWQVGSVDQIKADTDYRATFTFKLDRSKLPKLMEIGLVNSRDWDLNLRFDSPFRWSGE